MTLTNTHIIKSRPLKRPYKLSDAGGMYLLVTPSGAKYWRLKYRIHGKEKTMALGVYPRVSLAQARDERDMAKKKIRVGIDPVAERKEKKRLKEIESANTFETVAQEWIEQQRRQWTPDHAQRVMESLEHEVFPAIGKKPITDITAQEVLAVVRKVERRGALDVASRVLQRTGSVFRYAVQTGRIEINPATELRGAIKTRKVRHQPALKAADLPIFLQSLDHYEGDPITILALRLLMLTFVRPGELRGARWTEFDMEKIEWRIPEARMKMRHEHIVPLSRQALQVLSELRPLTGHHELLFTSRNGEGKSISENTLTYAMYRMGYHSRATAHGFRATASTILNEQGWRPDVIERQLAHSEKNKVRAAYHRAEYLDDRRRMMQTWADYLDSMRSGANVVNIKRA
ncbi:MAG: tyrosine-type recombinase/integrase [Gammaproteobacteria bacterium]|nr:tyrosine-type recombinase/integrase [Gammaproteobacteria bacterium]